MKTPAEQARERAGYIGKPGLKRLAKRLHYSERTVRHYELNGGASDNFCRRWSVVTGEPSQLVFYPPSYFSGAAKTPSPLRLATSQQGTPILRLVVGGLLSNTNCPSDRS